MRAHPHTASLAARPAVAHATTTAFLWPGNYADNTSYLSTGLKYQAGARLAVRTISAKRHAHAANDRVDLL